jgi:hypothetical protein
MVGAAAALSVAWAAYAANHDLLLAKPDEEQNRILAAIISSAGFACPKVTRKMFVGTDAKQTGYFSVACSDGQEWMVRVSDDTKGQTSAMPCTTLEVLKVKCWEKM